MKFSAFLMCVWLAAPAWGEPATVQKSGSWGTSESYRKLYEQGVAAEVTGQVLSTGQFRPDGNDEPGVEVRLATESGEYTVHLGPRWFVLENDLNFTRGERLSIVGVKIQFQRSPVIVANQVARRERKVILRDLATGHPRWPGAPRAGGVKP